MPLALNHATAVAHRSDLFVHGGYTGARDLSAPAGALLRYDPELGRWRRLPSSPTPRAAHALAAIGGRLYAAGGANPDDAAGDGMRGRDGNAEMGCSE